MNELWEPIGSGLAFFAAILGWVWHAARLASKIDQMSEKIDRHVDGEEQIWAENRRTHELLKDKISQLREDLAGVMWKDHNRNRHREEE